MAQVTYSHVGNDKLRIDFPLSEGIQSIFADTVITPDGYRCIIYDNYIVSLKQMYQNATDIGFYVSKIQLAFDNIILGNNNSDTIKVMVSNHVSQFGRVIDSDLMMMASAISRVREVFGDNYNIDSIVSDALEVAKTSFRDKLFITLYQKTMMGIQPSLIPATEYTDF